VTTDHLVRTARTIGLWLTLPSTLAACGGTLDAGSDELRGQLPVDDRNPVVICNDGPHDNWQGEYAMLFANAGGPQLAGIIVSAAANWPDLDANLAGWQQMVTAGREGGLANVPDPVASDGPVLVRPSDGQVDSTEPNESAGARFIIDAANRFAQARRPLVVVTGGRLTDVADAYLLDPTLPDRVVVVSSLGSVTPDGGEMGIPNGELDAWAGVVVAQRFRYVQISAFYDQLADVPSSRLSELPTNAFGAWIQSKQAGLWEDPVGADQVGILAVAVPEFVSSVVRAAPTEENAEGPATLFDDPEGSAWLVTEVTGNVATTRFWEMLLDPGTYRSR